MCFIFTRPVLWSLCLNLVQHFHCWCINLQWTLTVLGVDNKWTKWGWGGTMAQWCITPCCRNQKGEPTPMAADVDKASWTVSTVYSSEQVVRYYLASLFMAKTAFQKQLLMNTVFALKMVLCSQQAGRTPFDEHWPTDQPPGTYIIAF